MCEWYEKHFLSIEFLLSMIIASIIIVILIFIAPLNWTVEFQNFLKNPVFPVIATIGATLLGFIITGVSILISFPDSSNLRLFRQSKHYNTLFQIFFSAIKVLALTTIVALIGIFSPNKETAQIIFYFMIWSIIISSFRIYRCLWALENIIKIGGSTQ